MTRKQALEWIKVYSANGDFGAALRVYVETRSVSYKAFLEAELEGLRIARQNPDKIVGKQRTV